MSGPDQKENMPPAHLPVSNQSEKVAQSSDHIETTPSPEELRLERFGNSIDELDHAMDEDDEDDDDDDDEHDQISRHPLFGMLAGRLGQPRRRGSTHKYDSLHPVTSVLGFNNVDDCYRLEQSFPEAERATREKFEYRLSRCPELCFGLFTQPTKVEAEKSGTASQRTLIAMVIATRTSAPGVTDASMGVPADWKTNKSPASTTTSDETLGHHDIGGTVALHSLVVDPEQRNKGLATVLLQSYVQRIKDARIADRIALLAHDELEGFYAKFGFENMGPSDCKHGGGGWNNMVLNFTDHDDD